MNNGAHQIDSMQPVVSGSSVVGYVALPRAITVPELVGDEWRYPETWTEAQRERFEAAKGESIAREREATAVQEKAAAILVSPEMLIAIAEGERDEMNRALAVTKREAEGAIGWLKARAKFGDDVRRIDGDEGDVIILRRLTEAQIEQNFRLMNEVGAAKRATLKPGATQAEAEAVEHEAGLAMLGVQRDLVINNATIPGEPDEKASAARLRLLMAKYWGLWPEMIKARDSMVRGFRVAEGKGSALS